MDNPTKRTIYISPVTRIEGHAKISIQLDEQGNVEDALFHVNEFRGFEKLISKPASIPLKPGLANGIISW